MFVYAVILSSQSIHADSQFQASNSKISLVTESLTLTENDELLVGIKFELEEGWHTYWENPGDAGEGASVNWSLSNDFEASEILWPGPHRIPVEPLMTFGYNDEVILLTKISSIKNASFPLDIKAKVGWYTCKDICIPQEGEVSLEINKGEILLTEESAEIDE